ncbi:MAG: DUF1707 domain-containing protein [Propioniciclava sp.]
MEASDSAHIRVGDAERDATIQQLQEAAGDGRLTLEELEERIAAAMQARTRGDLRAILVDLLPPAEVEVAINPGSVLARAGEVGWSWENPVVFTAKWDDVLRAGPWEVHPFLEARAEMSTVKLNFVDARVSVDRIDLVVVGGVGDVVLIVPRGWGVDLTYLERGMGTVKSHVDSKSTPGHPTIMVRGRARMGTVKARYPGRYDDWQRRRWLARGGGVRAKN